LRDTPALINHTAISADFGADRVRNRTFKGQSMRNIILVASLSLLSGACASVIDGTNQEIAIASNPSGANCDLTRNKGLLSSIVTPQTITIKKTKHDISVACNKTGYQTSTAVLTSKIQDATWGNIVLGGGIGWAIDSASGADNKYDKQLTVTLIPAVPGVTSTPAAVAVDAAGAAAVNAAAGTATTPAPVAPAPKMNF
jgi:hypothetical protein